MQKKRRNPSIGEIRYPNSFYSFILAAPNSKKNCSIDWDASLPSKSWCFWNLLFKDHYHGFPLLDKVNASLNNLVNGLKIYLFLKKGSIQHRQGDYIDPHFGGFLPLPFLEGQLILTGPIINFPQSAGAFRFYKYNINMDCLRHSVYFMCSSCVQCALPPQDNASQF